MLSGIRIAGIAALVFAGSGCAARGFVPPTGAGTPWPEGVAEWQRLTALCRGARVYTAEIGISGHAGAGRERLNATLQGALTRSGNIYLELPAPFGAAILYVAGDAQRATFYLPRDQRVLAAPARDILEALIGLRLGPAELLDLLGGCAGAAAPAKADARSYGDRAVIDTPDARVFMKRAAGAWQIQALVSGGLLVEYREIASDWPRQIRLTPNGRDGVPLALTLTLGEIAVNVDLPPNAFSVTVPPSTAPMTLEELRAAGPLGKGGH